MKEVLIYDTEFTAWTGSMARNWRGPGEFKEIVQIGAITLAAQDMNESGSFSVLIKPVKNPVLSSYFEKLTRITNQVNAALQAWRAKTADPTLDAARVKRWQDAAAKWGKLPKVKAGPNMIVHSPEGELKLLD